MNNEKRQCLNCGNEVTDNYCSICGQSVHTSRITPLHLVEELQYGLLHINKGLLYTVKELLVRPGTTMKNYLAGKRVKYMKPFLFLIIWGAVYSLVFHFFHFFPMKEMNNPDNEVLRYIPLYDWYSSHYSIVMLLTLPFFALSTYFLFYKSRYNYIEHLVVFSYINGAKTIILLLFYPLIYITKSTEVYHIVHIIATVYVIWGVSQFFKTSSWLKATGKVVLAMILAFLLITVIFTIAFEVLEYYDIRL
ncbi:DUF3667 domain-containing protein [uncultured Dysgonomonas sp.]|uniref:DUF3667 domain-containing protein n=1 Tax=uncultured Dysgonomonas sp. TaxID=206096 RepID=A0A212JPA6_9BACT|nr:DUF3667 domain-containing protein [uncultured Dysgonomonas sp.]SBW01238.1 conserved membrane hypothetical protein [uncultured Dysgonomonas sp.]